MSRNLKIGIGAGLIALIGLVVVLALIVANLGAIAAWIGFDAAGNLNGREGAIGLLLNPEARVTNVVQVRRRPRLLRALADNLRRRLRFRLRHRLRLCDLAGAATAGLLAAPRRPESRWPDGLHAAGRRWREAGLQRRLDARRR